MLDDVLAPSVAVPTAKEPQTMAMADHHAPRPGRGISPEEEEELVLPTGAGERTPFSLDVPVDQTETYMDEEPQLSGSLDVLHVTEPDVGGSIRLDDDYRSTEAAPATSPMPVGETVALNLPEEETDQPDELLRSHQDEILITSGSPKPAAPDPAPAAAQDGSSEVTMVDSRARHKATYQDQLARGVAAMEKQNWKDAVKYLAVAHAMEPTDDYCREKLREAHARQDSELG